MSQCNGCGAEIYWVKMESGKMMAVEPGGKVIDDNGDKVVVVKPHWRTCPEAGRFRKQNTPSRGRWKYPA